MQLSLSRSENRDDHQNAGISHVQKSHASKQMAQWKEKAHTLADLVLKQEEQKLNLQKEINLLKETQHLAAVDPEALLKLKNELLQAKSKLEQQSNELAVRESLLKTAAGAARKEVEELRLQNTKLHSEVEKLIKDNAQLSTVVKRSSQSSTPMKENSMGFIGPSPGKLPHVDAVTLQAMLREKEGELRVLREDNAAKQEELLHSLQTLQATQKRSEELRCQTVSLNNQIEILREAVRQKDGDVDDMMGDLEQLKSLQTSLEARDEECSKLHEILAEGVQQLAFMKNELGAAIDEVAMLHSVLRERDEQVSELKAKVEDLQSRLSALQGELETSSSCSSSDDDAEEAHALAVTVVVAAAQKEASASGSGAPAAVTDSVVATAQEVHTSNEAEAALVEAEHQAHGKRAKKIGEVFAKTFLAARLAVLVATLIQKIVS